jgi:hypothetical protein
LHNCRIKQRKLKASKKSEYCEYSHRQLQIDPNALLHWKAKEKHLLVRGCGQESQHFREFVASENSYRTGLDDLHKMMAVFSAAREDFDGCYLTSNRSIVLAELFESELDQATKLPTNGHIVAAAVIAGTFLETALRELCDRNQLSSGMIDRMNADLARKSVYNSNIAKRITCTSGAYEIVQPMESQMSSQMVT